jgi:hypothetical protein
VCTWDPIIAPATATTSVTRTRERRKSRPIQGRMRVRLRVMAATSRETSSAPRESSTTTTTASSNAPKLRICYWAVPKAARMVTAPRAKRPMVIHTQREDVLGCWRARLTCAASGTGGALVSGAGGFMMFNITSLLSSHLHPSSSRGTCLRLCPSSWSASRATHSREDGSSGQGWYS